jgi:hypothetical protein
LEGQYNGLEEGVVPVVCQAWRLTWRCESSGGLDGRNP